MRIWSLHPSYLDRMGLLAVWRETLLAQKVLRGETKAYKNHPQLLRFKSYEQPLSAIATYLWELLVEAEQRHYNFNKNLISSTRGELGVLEVSKGQLCFEREHLASKLRRRCPSALTLLPSADYLKANPLFRVVDGEIENWERI